ncbi:hypothetical protein VTK56DRAFT_6444 [Thermocarpiscus australiensis]
MMMKVMNLDVPRQARELGSGYMWEGLKRMASTRITGVPTVGKGTSGCSFANPIASRFLSKWPTSKAGTRAAPQLTKFGSRCAPHYTFYNSSCEPTALHPRHRAPQKGNSLLGTPRAWIEQVSNATFLIGSKTVQSFHGKACSPHPCSARCNTVPRLNSIGRPALPGIAFLRSTLHGGSTGTIRVYKRGLVAQQTRGFADLELNR